MTLYYKRRRRRIILFIVLPCVIISLAIYFYSEISKNFIDLSQEEVYSACFNLINSVISDKISEIGAENIIDYKYDNTGSLIAVNANVVAMNILNTKIAEEITNNLSKLDNLYVKIPLGSFFSSNIFAGVGPDIPIRILPLSIVHTEYNTEFTSTGINQTQHKIFIKINCTVGVLSSLSNRAQEINIEIPIAETIIIGNVPQTFFQVPQQN